MWPIIGEKNEREKKMAPIGTVHVRTVDVHRQFMDNLLGKQRIRVERYRMVQESWSKQPCVCTKCAV